MTLPPLVIAIFELLLMTAVPLILFAIVIHKIEKLTQRRLAERFGWRSVMWTGWLGTPVHELSHAAMCVLFRHQIDEIALFEPDEEAGRLGYVRHSFRHGNKFEELGNFFIGLAPLAGGSIVLTVLLWMFYPDAARQAIGAVLEGSAFQGPSNISNARFGGIASGQGTLSSVSSPASVLSNVVTITQTLFARVFATENLGSGRFWGFLYLVLCVGSHMAPSRSDYAGARRGLWIFLAGVAVIVVLIAMVTKNNPQSVLWLATLMSPLLAVLLLTVALCGTAAAAIYVLTSFFPVRFEQV